VRNRPERQARAGRLLPIALFTLLVVSAYADPLFFRRNFAGRDLDVYNLPLEKAMHDSYARGRLPVWMPEISGGRPLAPNPNAGAMYPVRPLLSVLPFALAMRLFPVLHWIAAGIGMILLLRSLGASRSGAWLGAVTYVFSGVGVAEVFYPNLHPGMALLPWVVWTVSRPARPGVGKLAALSVLFSLDFLAGDVFTIGMAVVSALVWIWIEKGKADRARELRVLVTALGLAALFAAPQIVATALWAPETNRAVVGMRLRESLFFSVHPLRLVELLIPFPYGANWQLDDTAVWGWPVFRYRAMGMFTSLFAGAFAVVALVASRREKAVGFRFGRVLFLIALLTSVLPSLVPAAWEKLSSPLPLRNPEKFSVALVFALAITAGLCFDLLRSGRLGPARWPLGAAGVLTALAVVALTFPEAAGWSGVHVTGDLRFEVAASRQIPRALAEAALLWTVTAVALDRLRRPTPLATAVAVVLLTAVPILACRKIARVVQERDLFSPPRLARILGRLDPQGAYRTLDETIYFPPVTASMWPRDAYSDQDRLSWKRHTQALWGRGIVFNIDFDAGDFSRMEGLRRLSVRAAGSPDSELFFESFSLRGGVRYRDQRPLAGFLRFGGDAVQEWDVNDRAEPDIRLARKWIEAPLPVDSAAALLNLKEGEIVVETGRQGSGRAAPGIVHVLRRDPESLLIETVAAESSWLFVLRGFWSHRDILVDGRPVEAVPAQLAFSAVAVPAGRHRVDWRERVPGGRISRWGPAIAILLGVWLRIRAARPGSGRRQAWN
jgi:hypothetical protein